MSILNAILALIFVPDVVTLLSSFFASLFGGGGAM